MVDLFLVSGLPRDCLAGLPKKSVWYEFSLKSSLKCQRTKKKRWKERRERREYEEFKRKENKNIATFHHVFAALSSSPLQKGGGVDFREGSNCLSLQQQARLPGLWSVGPLWKLPLKRTGKEAELLLSS